MKNEARIRGSLGGSDAILAISVIGIILLLIVPIHPFLLDILLCLSIVFSVMTLLLTLFIENPLEFSAFPSLLLFLTLYRLGLNIASTRMILTQVKAGDIIETFGGFVTKGNVLVGLILFALVAVINFIVVTKGAGRIAEVAARFTLEALPGKQMAIDAEINANHLTRSQAKLERTKLNSQAEFYGAMDGASKFVRGEAIASIVITAVNILGGLVLGITVKNLSWSSCFSTFTKLTIGDGLVSAIPALLASVSAGIMVTSSSAGALGKTLPKQVLAYPKVLGFTAILIFLLGLLPGMPFFLMLVMAFALGASALFRLKKNQKLSEEDQTTEQALEQALIVHPIAIDVGVQLIEKVDEIKAAVAEVRQRVAEKIGVIIPSVSIRCSATLPKEAYLIRIKGSKMGVGNGSIGSIVEDLRRIVLQNADKLLNRQEVSHLVESAKAIDLALVEELIPLKLSLGQVLKVLQNLLKEQIPIRDFVSILEILADKLQEGGTYDPNTLTEHVRGGLGRVISDHFFADQTEIYVITLDPKVEKMIAASISKSNPAADVVLRPQTKERLLKTIEMFLQQANKNLPLTVILTSASTRRHLRSLLEQKNPHLPVLSYGEVALELQTHTIGVVPSDILI